MSERIRIGQTRGDLSVRQIQGDAVVVREADGSLAVWAKRDVLALPVTKRSIGEVLGESFVAPYDPSSGVSGDQP